MSFNAKASLGRLLYLALLLFPLSGLQTFGDDDQSAPKVVPQDSYELRFLGCKLSKDSSSLSHIGLFLLIWKGQNPIKILAYPSTDKKTFLPFPSFSLHHESGWRSVGGWCGTGTDWVPVQPGQVIPFSMDLGWVEHDIPGSSAVKGADKARLNLDSTDGDMVSDEFPLPLFPASEK